MFDIIMNRQVVGNARVDKEGLFYKIHCTCKVPDEAFYKIYMNDGEINRDLGICVPSGDFFVLTARVPCKQIKVESLSFSLELQMNPSITWKNWKLPVSKQKTDSLRLL